MRDLTQHRIVVVGPDAGSSGPGDHTEHVVDVARTVSSDVVEVRHGPPGAASLRDVRRSLRQVAEALATAPGGRVVLHVEASGGAIVPFWAARLGVRRGVPVSATVHDPPGLVWWPWRTTWMAEHRLVNHLVHVATLPWTRWLERRTARRLTLVTLSDAGAAIVSRRLPGADVRRSALPVLDPGPLPLPSARPRAVGLFGHVYRGKGFELLGRIRDSLPPDVSLRVAGRGTEALPPLPGVEVLGGLDDERTREFFGSIQVLLLPYTTRHVYGWPSHPASGVHATAISHLTPVVALDWGSTTDVGTTGTGVVVTAGVTELVRSATALLDEPQRLDDLAGAARRHRVTRGLDQLATDYRAVWSGA